MYTKKRDCNVAVPLLEALVLPYYPNSNTEPTPYVRIHGKVYKIHTNEHLCVAMFWVI